MALAQRLRGPRHHIYVMMSDGDMQSGVAWEGAMAASKFRTSEVTVLMDYNDVQLDGAAHDIMPLEPLVDKWRAFGFAVIEINGHNLGQVLDALDTALRIAVAHCHRRPHHQGQRRFFWRTRPSGTAQCPTKSTQARAELKGYEHEIPQRQAYGMTGITVPSTCVVVLDADVSSST